MARSRRKSVGKKSKSPKRRHYAGPVTKRYWYTGRDYDRIAAAIGREFLPARVRHRAELFERAANWYRSARDAPDRSRPSVSKRKLENVAKAARRLLKHLGVADLRQAPDGTADPDLYDALAGVEHLVTPAMSRIGWFAEVVEVAASTQTIERCALKEALEETEFGITGRKGHSGQVAENAWIADAMEIYEKCKGKSGGAGLIPFLKAAAEPLGIRYSAASWRSRVRHARKSRP